MTGRQDIAPVASVKTETLHKDSYQKEDEIHRKTKSLKPSARSVLSSRSPKPPMEIYSPRKILNKSGSKVHFADLTEKYFPSTENSISPPRVIPPPVALKSALKRSKSFTTSETSELETIGFEKDTFPMEYQGLIKRAVLDPNSLTSQKLMELVRLICCKAFERIQYSCPAANLCFAIIEKEHDHTFLESLQNCCREWYNERDKLLRAPVLTSHGISAPGLRRWAAYISFLTELYWRIKGQHLQSGVSDFIGPHPNSPMGHLALTLQTLLFDCANVILKLPSLTNEGEIDILRKLLTTVGKELEQDAAQRMQHLMCNLRDAFINPSINTHIRKTLLEVIELRASKWQLDLPQTLYYFPYTRP